MLSRRVCAPRICLSCRFSLLRVGASAQRPPSQLYLDSLTGRRYISGNKSVIQPKERIEALLRGEATLAPERKTRKGKASKRRNAGPVPEWGLAPDMIEQAMPQAPANEPPTPVPSQETIELATKRMIEKQERRKKAQEQGFIRPGSTARPPRPKKQNPFRAAPDSSSSFIQETDKSHGDDDYFDKILSTLGSLAKEKEPATESSAKAFMEVPLRWKPDENASPQEMFIGRERPAKAPDANWKSPNPGIPADPYPGPPTEFKKAHYRSPKSKPSTTSPRTRDEKPASDSDALHHQSLEMDALGRRIDAIILDNPNNLSRKNNRPLVMPKSDSSDAKLDWNTLRPANTPGLDPTAEVAQNLDELRPVDTSTLTLKDYEKTRDFLVQAFTKDQLDAYLKLRHADVKKHETIQGVEYPWLERRGTWTPLELRGPGHMTPKQQVANRILSAVWGVDVLEDVMSVGSIKIWVPSRLLRFIAQSTTGAMRHITTGIIDKSLDEKITADDNEEVLYIQSRKASLSGILSRIDEVQNAIQVQTIYVKGVDAQNLVKPVLDELGRVTQTYIRLGANRTKADVAWMGRLRSPGDSAFPEASSHQAETKSDIVLRLLRGRDSQRITGTSEVIVRKAGSRSQSTLTPYYRDLRSLSWRDKLRSWSRLIAPIVKPSGEGNELPNLPLHNTVQLPAPDQDPEDKNVTKHLTATFGHILQEQTTSLGQDKSLCQVLSPVVPHPAAFTDFVKERDDITKRVYILLNFVPVATNSSGMQRTPEVRLKLPVDPERDFSNFTMSDTSSLYAMRMGYRKDLLLPEDDIDVRIDRQDTYELDMSSQPQIREFFAASEFNLVEGRLKTPSKTQITIPKSWLDTKYKRVSNTINYDFAGLEIHQTVDVKYGEMTLRYSSVEAGQHGGTRQELTFSTMLEVTKFPEQKAEFLKAVEGFASGKTFPWMGGHSLVREMPEIEDEVPADDVLDSIDIIGQDEHSSGAMQGTEDEHTFLQWQIEEALSSSQNLISSTQHILDNPSSIAEQDIDLDTLLSTSSQATSQEADDLMASIQASLSTTSLDSPTDLSLQEEEGSHQTLDAECEAALVTGEQLMSSIEDSLDTATIAVGEDTVVEVAEEQTHQFVGEKSEPTLTDESVASSTEEALTSTTEAQALVGDEKLPISEDIIAEASQAVDEDKSTPGVNTVQSAETDEAIEAVEPTHTTEAGEAAEPVGVAEPEEATTTETTTEASPIAETPVIEEAKAEEDVPSQAPELATASSEHKIEQPPAKPKEQKPVDESSPWGLAMNLFR